MSWFSVWWKKIKEPIETIGKAKVIEEIREVNIADNADDLAGDLFDLLEGFGIDLPDNVCDAVEQRIAKEGEELREEIIDMVERIQL